jgi:hypothetical protein
MLMPPPAQVATSTAQLLEAGIAQRGLEHAPTRRLANEKCRFWIIYNPQETPDNPGRFKLVIHVSRSTSVLIAIDREWFGSPGEPELNSLQFQLVEQLAAPGIW